MSIKLVMPSNHLILCHLLFPSSTSPSIFSNESALHIRWPKYWSFSFSISPSSGYSGLTSFRMDWISLQSKGLSNIFFKTAVQKLQFFDIQTSLWPNYHIWTRLLEKNIDFTIWSFVSKVMPLLLNMLSMFVIAFLPRSKHLLIL